MKVFFFFLSARFGLLILAAGLNFLILSPAGFARPGDPPAGRASMTCAVYDPEGEPVPNATVNLYLAAEPWGGHAPGRRETGPDGTVQFTNLTAGIYNVKVKSEEFMPASRESIVLLEDDETTIELRLVRGEEMISGRVKDEKGDPIESVSIRVSRGRTGNYQSVRPVSSDTKGEFECPGLSAGVYSLYFWKKGYVSRKLAGIDSGTTGLEVTLSSGAKLSGKIVTSAGRVPKKQVKLQLASNNMNFTRYVKLDADGSYRVEGLDPGTFLVSASREGKSSRETREITLKAGLEVDGADFTLIPGGVISGRVVSEEDGSPLPDISIWSQSEERRDSHSVRTDERGEYRFAGLSAGLYQVQAAVPSTWMLPRQERESLRRKVALEEGERQTVDFTVNVRPPMTIRGRVIKEDGSPADRAQIRTLKFFSREYDRRGRYSFYPDGYTDESGGFSLTVEPYDKIVVLARDEDHAWSESEPVLKEKGKTVYEVGITLETGNTVSGKVTDAEELPLQGVAIGYVRGKLDTAGSYHLRPVLETTTDEAGNYHLDHLPSGEQTLVASKEPYPRELLNVKLQTGSPEYGYDFVLQSGLKLSGYVKDESGLPLFRARVYCRGREYSPPRSSIRTDSAGYFEFDGLKDSSYRLQVSYPGYPTIRDKEVRPGSVPLVITLKKGETVSGTVLSAATGLPVTDFKVTVKKKLEGKEEGRPAYFYPPIRYAAGGKFTVSDIPAGKYRLEVKAAGLASVKIDPLVVKKGKVPDPLVISLKKGFTVGGTIRSARDNEPIKGVRVYLLDPGRDINDLEKRIIARGWSDVRGEFSIVGLSRGNWSLLACKKNYLPEEMEDIPFSDDPHDFSREIYLREDPEKLGEKEYRLKFLGFSIEDGDGDKISVKKVYPASAAEKAGLKPGDEIVSAGGEPCRQLFQFFREVPRKKGETVRFEVRRKAGKGLIPIEIKKDEKSDPLIW